MSKPRAYSVGTGESGGDHGHDRRNGSAHQPTEPLSGSKRVKTQNHTRHNNPEG